MEEEEGELFSVRCFVCDTFCVLGLIVVCESIYVFLLLFVVIGFLFRDFIGSMCVNYRLPVVRAATQSSDRSHQMCDDTETAAHSNRTQCHWHFRWPHMAPPIRPHASVASV